MDAVSDIGGKLESGAHLGRDQVEVLVVIGDVAQDVARVELEDALAALQGLRGPDPAGAAGALAQLCGAPDLVELQHRLDAWWPQPSG